MQALLIEETHPYVLRWPIVSGRLDLPRLNQPSKPQPQYESVQQIKADLEAIWRQAMVEIGAETETGGYSNLRAVLLVPDSFCRVQVRILIDVVFSLGFKAVLVHQVCDSTKVEP